MPMYKVAFEYLDESLYFKLGVEKRNKKWNAVVPACPLIPPQHKGWSCIHEEGCNKNCVLFVPCWTEVATSDLSLNFRYLEKRVHPYLGSQRLQITRHKAVYHGSGGGNG